MPEGIEPLFEGMQGFGDASTIVPDIKVVVEYSVTVH